MRPDFTIQSRIIRGAFIDACRCLVFTMRVLASALLKVVLGSNWQSTSAQMHMHAKLPPMSVLILKLNSRRNLIMGPQECEGTRAASRQMDRDLWRKRMVLLLIHH